VRPEQKAPELAPEPSGPNNVPDTTHPPAHVPAPPPKGEACTNRTTKCVVPNNR